MYCNLEYLSLHCNNNTAAAAATNTKFYCNNNEVNIIVYMSATRSREVLV